MKFSGGFSGGGIEKRKATSKLVEIDWHNGLLEIESKKNGKELTDVVFCGSQMNQDMALRDSSRP